MATSSGRLEGEVAVVTGSGGRGTGTVIAKVFADEGAKVIVTGRNTEQGRAVAAEICADGGEAVFVRADLAVRSDCDALIASAVEHFGRLTVLVNNAASGQSQDAAIGSVSDVAWDEAIQSNLTGFMYICRASIAAMLDAGKGSIVNVTSRVAIRGTPGLSAYTASKGAQNALTRAIAMDYSRQGIRCNAILPGFIVDKERDSEMTNEAAARYRQLQEELLSAHLTRMPTTLDIAHAAVWLASDESGSVTGIEVPVDGGGTQVRGSVLG